MSYGRMLDEAVLGIGSVMRRSENDEASRKREYIRKQKPLLAYAVELSITEQLEANDNIENIFADAFYKQAGAGSIYAGYQFVDETNGIARYRLTGLRKASQ